MCTSQTLPDSRGFTLIEVLIATMLLSVAFLGLASMTMGTIRGLSFSDKQTTATTLARAKIEQIKHATFPTVTTANYPPEDFQTMAGYARFHRAVTITDNTPEQHMKTITVTVSWRADSGKTRTVVLMTVIDQ